MNAVTSNRAIFVPSLAGGMAAGLREPVTAGVKFWPLLAVLTTFWVYVTVSNVTYATGMQASFSMMAPGHYFAPWDQRVLQHVFLYPVLVLCVLASLRLGWTPLWRTLPPQLGLGVVFSMLGSPAMIAAEFLLGSMADWKHTSPYTWREFLAGPEPAMWLASAQPSSSLNAYAASIAMRSQCRRNVTPDRSRGHSGAARRAEPGIHIHE